MKGKVRGGLFQGGCVRADGRRAGSSPSGLPIADLAGVRAGVHSSHVVLNGVEFSDPCTHRIGQGIVCRVHACKRCFAAYVGALQATEDRAETGFAHIREIGMKVLCATVRPNVLAVFHDVRHHEDLGMPGKQELRQDVFFEGAEPTRQVDLIRCGRCSVRVEQPPPSSAID